MYESILAKKGNREKEMDALEYLKSYEGKRIKVGLKSGEEYSGILRDVELSMHGGIGNILLEEIQGGERNSKWCIIRGSYVCYIALPNDS